MNLLFLLICYLLLWPWMSQLEDNFKSLKEVSYAKSSAQHWLKNIVQHYWLSYNFHLRMLIL